MTSSDVAVARSEEAGPPPAGGPSGGAVEHPDGSGTRPGRITSLLRRPALGALLGAAAVFVVFTVTDSTPQHLWLTQTGFQAWAQQAAFFGIMSVPVGLLMIGGEFDLSTGGMTGFCAIIMALLVGNEHWNAWAAVAVTFAFGALVGAVNGIVVTRSGLPSFIVTLATYFVFRGLSVGGVLKVNHGSTNIGLTGTRHPGLKSAKDVFGGSFAHSTGLPAGYQTAILWFVGVTAVAVWLLARTRFGNWVFAVGGDADAARKVGVPVRRTKVLLFMGTSTAAALVGVISFLQTNTAVSEQGVGYEFYYIIAAVVGGCLLTGGHGSALGAALGACIIGMALQGVIYSGWDSSWDFTFLGAILFLAVAVNTLTHRRAMRARR